MISNIIIFKYSISFLFDLNGRSYSGKRNIGNNLNKTISYLEV